MIREYWLNYSKSISKDLIKENGKIIDDTSNEKFIYKGKSELISLYSGHIEKLINISIHKNKKMIICDKCGAELTIN